MCAHSITTDSDRLISIEDDSSWRGKVNVRLCYVIAHCREVHPIVPAGRDYYQSIGFHRKALSPHLAYLASIPPALSLGFRCNAFRSNNILPNDISFGRNLFRVTETRFYLRPSRFNTSFNLWQMGLWKWRLSDSIEWCLPMKGYFQFKYCYILFKINVYSELHLSVKFENLLCKYYCKIIKIFPSISQKNK